MTKTETVVVEEPIVETVDTHTIELALCELDLVAGGSVVVGLA